MLALASVLAAACLAATPVSQFVPHDGAVRVTATDVEPKGSELALKRALTSSLPFSGQFGRGFGIEEELRVEPLHGGALRVTVPGPCPACSSAVPEPSPDALAKAVRDAAWTLRASGQSRLAGEAAAYAARLEADPAFRSSEWQVRRDAWLAAARDEPAGALERIPAAARYRVIALPSGYLRFADSSHVQELDADGRLEQVLTAAGVEKRLNRDAAGRITRIEDGKGIALVFELDASGLTTRVTLTGGEEATYGYDGAGRMLWSRSDAELTRYRWSGDGRLVGLTTPSGGEVTFGYQPASDGGRLVSLDDAQGIHERYVYEGDASGFTRGVTVLQCEGDARTVEDDEEAESSGPGPSAEGPRELRHYGYVTPLTADGRRWTWQETREEGGQLFTTIYDDRTFQVRSAAEDDRLARFAYDDQGRLLRKETLLEVTELTYGQAGKITSVVKRTGGGEVERSTYAYDDRGQLSAAEGPSGAARVAYDAQGRISTIDATRKGSTSHLTFLYGVGTRPTRIESAGIGAITIRYRPDGEIDGVASEGGRKISLAVTTGFGALLDLIRPAGVRISAW